MANTPAGVSPATTAPSRVDLLNRIETSIGASLVGCTLVRHRGIMALTGAPAETDVSAALLVTAYIGDNNDVDRGTIPEDSAFNPLSENRDYFLWEPFFWESGNAGTSLTRIGGSDATARLIDVKASRKIEEVNQAAILDVSAQAVESGVSIPGLYVNLSTLVMLP